MPQDEEIEVFGTLLDLEPRRGRADPRDQADAVVADIAGRLRDRFGQGWPGAPGGTDLQPGATAGGAGVQNQMPNPDAYAFYQSWHRDLPRDTTHSIIRGAGIPMPLGQLTAASDAELRTAGRVA
ncbi:hypothetical protein [Dankookia sp. P2]|uniref:hypothetical protein n=1 Tax=Dankookia sp. P2 TaxID=3423955 RepID=UPI003D67E384